MRRVVVKIDHVNPDDKYIRVHIANLTVLLLMIGLIYYADYLRVGRLRALEAATDDSQERLELQIEHIKALVLYWSLVAAFRLAVGITDMFLIHLILRFSKKQEETKQIDPVTGRLVNRLCI